MQAILKNHFDNYIAKWSRRTESWRLHFLVSSLTVLTAACAPAIYAQNYMKPHNVSVTTRRGTQIHTERRLNPYKTWLFAIGILTFSNNASWDSSNRRDTQIVSEFRRRGLPSDHIDYIADRRGSLETIKREFISFLERTQKGDFLIHYYTGHGGDGSFETTYGKSYNHAWIARQIASKFHGVQVLLLGDCCYSGSLQRVVGNVHGPIAFACLTSSSRKQSGHGNWTFSQAILDGLRGEPYVDLNKDGHITIDELAAHVGHDIRVYENNRSIYRKTPNFDGKMIVAETRLTNEAAPEPVRAWYHGKWWKAKLMEQSGGRGRIRWIQLGYDSPQQDVWIDMKHVRPL